MTKEFNSYRIYYQSTPRYYWQSRVFLYMDGAYVGKIMFIKEENSIPENTASREKITLNFPTSLFTEIMDILRLEKPLYLTLNTSNGIGTISTSNEPVGEEEGEIIETA